MTEPMPYLPPEQPSEHPSDHPLESTGPHQESVHGSFPAPVQDPESFPPAPDGPNPPPPATRRVWLLPAATGVAGLAIGALIASAIVSSNSSSPASASVADAGTSAAPSAPATAASGTGANGTGKKSAQARGVRGVITAESGSTWTVRSQAGPLVTVTISTTTKFGTKKLAATRSQFVTDSPVLVVGPRAGDTVTARRVILAKAGDTGKRTTPSALPTS